MHNRCNMEKHSEGNKHSSKRPCLILTFLLENKFDIYITFHGFTAYLLVKKTETISIGQLRRTIALSLLLFVIQNFLFVILIPNFRFPGFNKLVLHS